MKKGLLLELLEVIIEILSKIRPREWLFILILSTLTYFSDEDAKVDYFFLKSIFIVGIIMIVGFWRASKHSKT